MTSRKKSWGAKSSPSLAAQNPSQAEQEILPQADQIYLNLRNRICTNQFGPGDIIREAELADEFDVSRSPIRRALAKLEHDGLVEVRHGVGTRVTKPGWQELASIYTVRMMLWAQSGPFFQSPLPLSLADKLEAHIADFRALPKLDLFGFADLNIDYYMDLTAAVENVCLRDMHRNLFFSTSRMWLVQLPMLEWDRIIDAICEEIRNEISAIRADDEMGLGYVARNAISMNLVNFTKQEP
jgi:DNA-binding GntR family transcriptional regulator